MLQSHLEATSQPSTADFKLPPNLFLLDPDNANRLNGKSQLVRLLKKEVFALAALSFLCGLFLVTFIQEFHPLFITSQIQWSGIAVQGIVTAKDTTVCSQNVTDKCNLSYRFTTLTGTQVNTQQAVTRLTFDQFQVGDSLSVKYLADNPALSAVTAEAQYNRLTKGNFVVGSTTSTGFIIALGALFYLSRYLWRENRFFVQGQLRQGHVLSCHGYLEILPKNVDVKVKDAKFQGMYMIDIAYAFQSPAGKTIKSHTTRQRNDLRGCHLPSFGQPIAVLYLDDDRHRLL